MRFAPIVPVQYHPAGFSNFHLILAHEVLQDPFIREYYQKLPDAHIILDNSVIELGDAMSFDDMLEARTHFPQSWLVVPDALRDFDKTVSNGARFARHMGKVSDYDWGRLMIVPQAETIEEWLECLSTLVPMYRRNATLCVGIGRLFEDQVEGGRRALYEMAQSIWPGPYHLLGIQHQIQEVYWAKDKENVWGCDSSLPARAALVGKASDAIEDLRKEPDVTEYNSEIHGQVQNEMKRCVDLLRAEQAVW